MRVFTVFVTALVMGSATLPAFADNATNTSDVTRICESARLTDIERRECRAMVKAAASDEAREEVLRTFAERIGGAVTGAR